MDSPSCNIIASWDSSGRPEKTEEMVTTEDQSTETNGIEIKNELLKTEKLFILTFNEKIKRSKSRSKS